MNKHTNQKLFDAYDENWHKLFFDIKSGGYLVAHKRHDLRELSQNIAVGLRLARLGECVELLPDTPHAPSADATRNGEVWEIKTTNGSESSIQNRIRKGKSQSKNRLLVFPDNFDEAEVITALINAINMDKRNEVSLLHLLFVNDKIAVLTKEDIRFRRFEKFFDALK
ncbi:MAG: hypothetical protein JNL70_09630 [Saprospiraceae bacterium]|nr:hypothetical protein [Saprospiraceae bacterium]